MEIDIPPYYEQIKSRDNLVIVGFGDLVKNGFLFSTSPQKEVLI
jgi:hypothetical protein